MNRSEKQRVLVIDDNPSIHEDFRKILGGDLSHSSSLDDKEALLFGDKQAARPTVGFEINSAYQGEEGLRLVAQARHEGRPYCVAFIDIRMPPGWDGVETIERIGPVDPDIQFVVCSAYSDYSAHDILLRLGISDRLLLLRKPCDSAEILLMATALCEKWSLSQATRSNRARSADSAPATPTPPTEQAACTPSKTL